VPSRASGFVLRRVSSVAAHSGDRLLSEPSADAQPEGQELVFMAPHLPFAIPIEIGSVE